METQGTYSKASSLSSRQRSTIISLADEQTTLSDTHRFLVEQAMAWNMNRRIAAKLIDQLSEG